MSNLQDAYKEFKASGGSGSEAIDKIIAALVAAANPAAPSKVEKGSVKQ